LHVRAPNLDDVIPFLRLRADGIAQGRDCRNEPLLHVDGRGDVHRRRKRIVRGLRHVDVVVGMNRHLAPERRTGELAAAVGDDFVDVHVELGAAPCHPNVQGKHVVMLPGENFVTHFDDQSMTLIVQPFAGVVRGGRGFLQGGIGNDHFAGDQILADAEMLE
jgi:hypothetical protein